MFHSEFWQSESGVVAEQQGSNSSQQPGTFTSQKYQEEQKENDNEGKEYDDNFAAGPQEDKEKYDQMINFIETSSIDSKRLVKFCEKFKKSKLTIVGSGVEMLKNEIQDLKVGDYEVKIYRREKDEKKYAILRTIKLTHPWQQSTKKEVQNHAREIVKKYLIK